MFYGERLLSIRKLIESRQLTIRYTGTTNRAIKFAEYGGTSTIFRYLNRRDLILLSTPDLKALDLTPKTLLSKRQVADDWSILTRPDLMGDLPSFIAQKRIWHARRTKYVILRNFVYDMQDCTNI